MRKIALTLLIGMFCSSLHSQTRTIAEYVKDAPFSMPEVVVPTFPKVSFNVLDYGAVGDGQTLNHEAFQKAIDECASKGGGVVIVPKGLWLTGPIELRSNVNLHVERAALITFSTDFSLYKAVNGDMRAPISGTKLKNIAITGNGVIDGSGEAWRPVKKMKTTESQWKKLLKKGGVLSDNETIWWPNEDFLKKDNRPYMVFLKNCENVLVEGVTLRNSPKFVLYPNNCKNVTIQYVSVFNDWWAQNGDGIDISACKNVVVYNCEVNVGDDALCLKSSGKSTSPKLENVLIAACNVYHGHGGFVIGSNTDGGMNNVFVTDCNFVGTDIGIRVKSNGGRGGEVQNIFIQNIYMNNIAEEAIHIDTYYQNIPAGAKRVDESLLPKDKMPDFKNFFLKNIYCSGAEKAAYIRGIESYPIRDFSFENVVISAKEGFYASYAKDFKFNNVKVITSNNNLEYVLDNTTGITPPKK